MQKYDALENGIANNDVKALREAIGSICYTSRDFSSGEFDEAVKYVESKGIKIKDDILTGGPIISSQKDIFNDEDFAKAIFALKKNFCDERIEDVKIIGKKLYAVKEQSKTESESIHEKHVRPSSNGTSPNQQSHQQESKTGRMVLVALVMIILILLIIFSEK